MIKAKKSLGQNFLIDRNILEKIINVTKIENKTRVSHEYKVGDEILLKNAWKTKFNQDAYLGPYTITAVRNNGTVRARKGKVTDTYNLRNIKPYQR